MMMAQLGLLALIGPTLRCRTPTAPFAASLSNRHPPVVAAASPDQVQLATALVTPLLAYKIAATLQGNRLMWYLDVSIALATFALLKYAFDF